MNFTQRPEEEHKARLKEVLDTTTLQHHRKWLKSSLRWSNEPSLEQRLTKIVDRFATIASLFIDNNTDFVKKVADTRNDFAHGLNKREPTVAKGHDLYALSQRAKMLMQVCLLNELGFSPE